MYHKKHNENCLEEKSNKAFFNLMLIKTSIDNFQLSKTLKDLQVISTVVTGEI